MQLGDGTKGAMTGAVLGGLLAGPFGAIWGSQIGGSVGAARGADRANEERLERMGLSKEMRATAATCAAELAEAEEGLQTARRALASAEEFARTLQEAADASYEKAQAALLDGDEAAARVHLVERQQTNLRVSSVPEPTSSAQSVREIRHLKK